ncbi:hypothetical protein AB1Y20_004594 [Prymnesium parvum]|uniref:Uncharacterized protein n=1 Tax=Prymnesium parvum TaxID=97485 RepID=A0AB34IZK4_PRYPA
MTALASSNSRVQVDLAGSHLAALVLAVEEGASRNMENTRGSASFTELSRDPITPLIDWSLNASAGGAARGLGASPWLDDTSPSLCAIELLRDNLQSCANVSEEIIRRLAACLRPSDRATRILQLFEVMCEVKEGYGVTTDAATGFPTFKPICRNQKLIIRALAERRSVLLLFNGQEGRKQRQELFERLDDAACATRFHYHEQMLKLLLKCVRGRHQPSDTERTDKMAAEHTFRSILPLDELVEHALDSTTSSGVRVVYMQLMREGIIDSLLPYPGLLHRPGVIRLLDVMVGEQGRFLTVEHAAAAGVELDLEELDIEAARHLLYDGWLPLLLAILERHGVGTAVKRADAPMYAGKLQLKAIMAELLQSLRRFGPLLEADKSAGELNAARHYFLDRCVLMLQEVTHEKRRDMLPAKCAEWRSNHMLLRLHIETGPMAMPARLKNIETTCDKYIMLQESLKEYAHKMRTEHERRQGHSTTSLLLEQLQTRTVQAPDEENGWLTNAMIRGAVVGKRVTSGISEVISSGDSKPSKSSAGRLPDHDSIGRPLKTSMNHLQVVIEILAAVLRQETMPVMSPQASQAAVAREEDFTDLQTLDNSSALFIEQMSWRGVAYAAALRTFVGPFSAAHHLFAMTQRSTVSSRGVG